MAMLKAPAKVQAEQGGDTSPAFKAAFDLAMQSLYGDGAAAKDVVQAMKSAGDPVDALADTAYRMVEIVDEKTGGTVPDEEMVALAANILGEVAEIAKAAGIQVNGKTIADATRNMLVRYVTEQGMDASQLQQAMGQVDTGQLGAALDKMGG